MSGMTINRITFGLATSFGDDLTVCPAGQQLWLISKVVVEPWAVDGDDARMRLLGVRQFEGVSAWVHEVPVWRLSGQDQQPLTTVSMLPMLPTFTGPQKASKDSKLATWRQRVAG